MNILEAGSLNQSNVYGQVSIQAMDSLLHSLQSNSVSVGPIMFDPAGPQQPSVLDPKPTSQWARDIHQVVDVHVRRIQELARNVNDGMYVLSPTHKRYT